MPLRAVSTTSESSVTFFSGFFRVWYMVVAIAIGVGVKVWTWSSLKLFFLSHSARFSMSSSVLPGWAAMK